MNPKGQPFTWSAKDGLPCAVHKERATSESRKVYTPLRGTPPRRCSSLYCVARLSEMAELKSQTDKNLSFNIERPNYIVISIKHFSHNFLSFIIVFLKVLQVLIIYVKISCKIHYFLWTIKVKLYQTF